MLSAKNFGLPSFGAGVGLRHRYLSQIVALSPKIDWFEVIVEDFFDIGGEEAALLEVIGEKYQLIAHGVCLSIGSSDKLDFDYLAKLKKFIRKINSPWTSDHLSFTRVDHQNLNDLLPLPYTKECLDNLVNKVKEVQDFLETPFLLENISRYITPSAREMSELEFINQTLERSGCGLLLDLTNVHLNAHHHSFDAYDYLKSLPLNRIAQVHLAGWKPDSDGQLIDSHDAEVPKEIWELFKWFTTQAGPTSALIEWDKALPDLSTLEEEARKARIILREYGAS
jgi:hypothetical protein